MKLQLTNDIKIQILKEILHNDANSVREVIERVYKINGCQVSFQGIYQRMKELKMAGILLKEFSSSVAGIGINKNIIEDVKKIIELYETIKDSEKKLIAKVNGGKDVLDY